MYIYDSLQTMFLGAQSNYEKKCHWYADGSRVLCGCKLIYL